VVHKHRPRCFGIMGGHDLFLNIGHALISVIKVPDCGPINEHNILLNFPRCLSIFLLQTNKTDNNY
jgi:hypothetical protein